MQLKHLWTLNATASPRRAQVAFKVRCFSEDPDDDTYVELVRHALEAGLGDHVLLSHDRGWFDPAQPNGGAPSAFTYITDVFLPKLRGVGVDDIALRQLTQVNPFRAFAR